MNNQILIVLEQHHGDFNIQKEKNAIRMAIQCFSLKGKTVEKIHEKIFPTFSDSYSSYEAIRY